MSARQKKQSIHSSKISKKSELEQIHAAKSVNLSKMDLSFYSLDPWYLEEIDDLIVANENKVNIPYHFKEKNYDEKNDVNTEASSPSPKLKTSEISKLQKAPQKIKHPFEDREYFQTEFYNKALYDVINENMNTYENYENLHKDTKTPVKLQIHLLSYKNSNNCRINKFRTEFFAPCKAHEFIEIANNLEIQKHLDGNCDENKILEEFEKNINLSYLSYKKNYFCSARDFVYLKVIKNVEMNGKSYWCDGAKSIETQFYPPIHKVIRCQNIKSGHLIEDLSNERENKCLVKFYSECDFKVDLPLFMIRNFISSEMKKMNEKVIKKIHEVISF